MINFNDYQKLAKATAIYPTTHLSLMYTALGLAGEAGEVANVVKKSYRDDAGQITDERRLKLKDELGDVLWYISACADELGIELGEVADHNIAKLAARHNPMPFQPEPCLIGEKYDNTDICQ